MTPRSSDAWEIVAGLLRAGEDCVVVTITGVRGSVPGCAGNKAIVNRRGLVTGTLGGGKVEARAIQEAVEMLDGCAAAAVTERTWNLQQDTGMTCGGEMRMLFERVRAKAPWHIVLFGAGHVAQALVPVLAPLACQIEVIDERSDWLARLPTASNVEPREVEHFEDGVALLRADSFLLTVTKGHATDRPVLRDALRRFPTLPFVGVIGSASKRAVLLRELREDGIPDDALAKIECPVGLPIGGNDPAEIAISIAARLLERRG